MVVSGVPKLNGRDHSSEICTMALDVLREITEIVIPHMPNEHLFMRIGIHTGKYSNTVKRDPYHYIFVLAQKEITSFIK
jgi:hypothetical protein